MTLITCKDCENQVSAEAKICPRCGARTPKDNKRWWAVFIFFILIFVFFVSTGPKTTADLAEMETERCIRLRGDGEWRGSLGVSLETFCKTKGALIGLKRACELNPSRC